MNRASQVITITMLAALAHAHAQDCRALMPRPTLHALGGDRQDRFGNDVAVDGGMALIGAPYAGAGLGYILERTASGAWFETARLTVPSPGVSDAIGSTVSLRGDVAVLSAPHDRQFAVNSGAAHVFHRGPGGAWSYAAKLTSPDPGPAELFGDYGAVTDGRSIIVASRDDDDFSRQSGSASIFELREGAWVHAAQLYDIDPRTDEYFGSGVGIDGDTAIVGCVYDLTGGPALMQCGSASIFRRVSGVWAFEQKLTAIDRHLWQNFGWSVAVSGDAVVIGAQRDEELGTVAGAAYIFRCGPAGVWAQEAKLLAPDGVAYDEFGTSVALHGDNAVVGCYNKDRRGAAYVYTRSPTGGWTFSAKLIAADGVQQDQFARAVAVSGPAVFIGNWADDDQGSDSGAAYVFEPCPADLACDALIDFADYLEFLNLYDAGC